MLQWQSVATVGYVQYHTDNQWTTAQFCLDVVLLICTAFNWPSVSVFHFKQYRSTYVTQLVTKILEVGTYQRANERSPLRSLVSLSSQFHPVGVKEEIVDWRPNLIGGRPRECLQQSFLSDQSVKKSVEVENCGSTPYWTWSSRPRASPNGRNFAVESKLFRPDRLHVGSRVPRSNHLWTEVKLGWAQPPTNHLQSATHWHFGRRKLEIVETPRRLVDPTMFHPVDYHFEGNFQLDHMVDCISRHQQFRLLNCSGKT